MPLDRLRTLPLDRLFAKLRHLKPAWVPTLASGDAAAVSAPSAAEPVDLPHGVPPLRILVSPLSGDSDGTAARHIHDRLAGRRGVTVRLADRMLTAPGADNMQPVFLSMAVDLGQRWLKRENADLLIWGEAMTPPPMADGAAPGGAWRLRFLGASTPVQPHGATFSALERLEIPAFFDDATGDLVFGTALAAVNVESAEGLRARAALFRPVLKAATLRVEGDSIGTVAACATAQACYAAMLLLDGAHKGDLKILERAVAVYQGALILGLDAFTEHERAMIGSHIADALMQIAELGRRPKLIQRSTAYYRTALGMVRKEVFAEDFAALKTRLGLALHAEAAVSGDAGHLKEAADAFSAATSIWTITEQPHRWADIQNSLGGLLITMGRITHQPSLFDKAVGVFAKIMEAQNRRQAPLIWAQTMANIGAALKEKGLAARDQELLQRAADAYQHAGKVFAELHLEKNAMMVEHQRAELMALMAAQ
jgi:tetratricopeptide (TPR) repeat protein